MRYRLIDVDPRMRHTALGGAALVVIVVAALVLWPVGGPSSSGTSSAPPSTNTPQAARQVTVNELTFVEQRIAAAALAIQQSHHSSTLPLTWVRQAIAQTPGAHGVTAQSDGSRVLLIGQATTNAGVVQACVRLDPALLDFGSTAVPCP